MADPFLDRLREAIVEPVDVDVDALKAAATAASTELGAERGLALVRVAYGQDVGPTVQADLRGRLNTKGESIEAHGQDQLVAVLAAEALIGAFTRTNYTRALLPALAVRCARHVGWRPVHPDIETHADAYLSHRSVLVRARENDVPDVKPNPDSPEGAAPPLEDELKVLRELVRSDRQIAAEREALGWWLLSETRPASLLALALEFNLYLRFLPEPLSGDEMLRAKLRRDPVDTGTPQIPVPEDVADFCPDLIGNVLLDDKLDPSKMVRRFFDQILLLRANAEAKR
jgi:hypothetical protein